MGAFCEQGVKGLTTFFDKKSGECARDVFGRLLGGSRCFTILYVLTIFVASEAGGEVAELYRPSESGQIEPVRVWVVDTNDGALIEHGDPNDWWIKNLTKRPTLKLRRSQRDTDDTDYSRKSPNRPAPSGPSRATAQTYAARAAPDRCAEYLKLRRAKYGFSDQLIGWLSFSRI